MNARKEAGIINPATGHYLELDIFLPSLKLAFEYQVRTTYVKHLVGLIFIMQERHHYLKGTQYTNKSLEEIQGTDKLKQGLASKHGITLVVIPCWWDNQIGSLAATIKLQRPELGARLSEVTQITTAISETPPENYFAKHVNEIEDIGEPVNPCFFIHSQTDPTNWYTMSPLALNLMTGFSIRWVFEKYDGIRGFWNPLKKAMFSRSGSKLELPQEVIDEMPQDSFLDGELWYVFVC